MSELLPSELPLAWLQRARSDLTLGRAALETPGVFLEDACFHAQQCAEKALKALLLHHTITFPRTHVLEVLLDLLRANEFELPSEVDEAFALSQYAMRSRLAILANGSRSRMPRLLLRCNRQNRSLSG